MKKALVFAIIFLIAFSMPMVFTAQVQALIVEPVLYAGVSNPAGVYRYDGGTSWTLIGSFPNDYAVLCLVKSEGELFAGTMSTSDPWDGIGRVYRYDGGSTWTLVGDNMDDQVTCLVVYDGNLYAGTASGRERLYRYDGDTTWTMVVDIDEWGFRSAFVWGDILCLGDIMHHLFGHYDGTIFTEDASFGNCEGIYDYEVYDGYIYAAAGESVDLYRSPDGTTWSVAIPIGWPDPTTPGYESTMRNWELETFEGYLYMSIDNGTLARWDGSSHSNVWETPDGQGVISMETCLGYMFLGVGGEAGAAYWGSTTGTGRVYSYDGTTFQLISEDMGIGVQVLYATEPLPRKLIATGWGVMWGKPQGYVRGPAELYMIGEAEIELAITFKDEEYSKTWKIVDHYMKDAWEIFECYNPDYGFFKVQIDGKTGYVQAYGTIARFTGRLVD